MLPDVLKKRKVRIITIAIISFLLLISIMVVYSKTQEQILEDQLKQTISKNTVEVARVVDSTVNYAINSIQVTSIAVSSTMTGEVLENPLEELKNYIENTPFNSIEYIRADGMNITDAGDPFDASNRVYYIEGMKGNTGIWVNFTPKYSKEPLLNFYTPLMYEGKIVGVLTGTVEGNSSIKNLLIDSMYDQSVVGIIIDENNTIIASTESFTPGTMISDETLRLRDGNKQRFLDAIKTADGKAFMMPGKKGSAIGAVSNDDKLGWKIIQIIPDSSQREIMAKSNNIAYLAVTGVVGVCIILFIVILIENNKVSKESITKANSERDDQLAILLSMADIYYSTILFDLKENKIIEYSARNQVKSVLDNSKDKSMSEIIGFIMKATMSDRDLQKGLDFTDITTIPQRLKGKKIISTDLLGKNVGWIRMSLITLETDEEGVPTRFMSTTQIIDDEKKKEESLLMKSNTDELTKLYNRRAYEEDLFAYSNNQNDNLVYVAIDINGLKVVNDTLGHDAGDELITGAANCIREGLGPYGKCYRVGGDEFVALIFAGEEQLDDIKKNLEDISIDWRGKLVDTLSISSGFVPRREYMDKTLMEIAAIADKKMYEEKESYYKSKGVDRRGQKAAHTALCALYTKILKINITEDSYQIVNMDLSEQTDEKGFSNSISGWLTEFGKSGQVHVDDLDEYLAKSNIAFLRDYFKRDKTSISIFYRRKIGKDYKQVVMDIIPADDYSHDNQNLFLYVKSIDK